MVALMLVGLFIILGASLVIYKISCREKSIQKAFLIAAASILLLSIGLELTLFNVNYYVSSKYTPTDLSDYMEEYKVGDVYEIPAGITLTFPELNQKVNNVRVNLSDSARNTVVTVKLTDDANMFFFSTPKRRVYPTVEKSEYINVHTSGESYSIALLLESEELVTPVDSVEINCNRPFEFSFMRVLVMFAILLFVYIFRPSSFLYKRKMSESKELKQTLTGAFICLQCAVIIILGSINPVFMGIEKTAEGIQCVPLSMEHHNQYDELAQAFLQGKTYIDNDDVPESLKQMVNPYDTSARSMQSQATGDSYRWDVAYFNGHYYVYFGIVPLLIMYLPFRIITNSPFPSAVGVILFSAIFAIGVFKLLGLLCEKKFKNVSVGAYLLCALTMVNCCGMTFLAKRPDFYSVPIITAMAFVVWGIFCWLKGLYSGNKQGVWFTLGSLCCALSVGCRPQSVLMCAVAIPLFWEYFFKDGIKVNKKKIKSLVLLGAPFVVVAAGIMYYNAIRFGSPFDFGSGYNLTTNDVSHRGFDIGRTGLGIFTYLFQPPVFSGVFPFIQSVPIDTNYIGKTITENCFGGLITCLPFLWVLGAVPSQRKILKEKGVFSLVCVLAAVGFAMVIADTQAGGLLQRYFSDFGYIFFLGAVLTVFALSDRLYMENNAKLLNKFIIFSSFLSIFYSIALAFSVSDVTINTTNPTLFATILHNVQFWL